MPPPWSIITTTLLSTFTPTLLLLLLLLPPPTSAECNLSNILECRSNLTKHIFGTSTLPKSKVTPDYIIDESESYQMHGWPSSGPGTSIGKISWSNGLRRYTWKIDGIATNLSLNATVLHTFNTSGNAPGNYPPFPQTPMSPSPEEPGYHSYKNRGDTLILYHHGHETFTCTPNYDGVPHYLNTLGYDVMEMFMPLIGCNEALQYNNPGYADSHSWANHKWFEQWEEQGEYTLKFFLEPVVLAINYAKEILGYESIVMIGLSGGGWTTTLASALDDRVDLSIPIAGSTPKLQTSYVPFYTPDWPEGRGDGEGGGGDYEQLNVGARKEDYEVCDFICMYMLATMGGEGVRRRRRFQLQLLHEFDSCCFAANGLHDDIRMYNDFIQSHRVLGGGDGDDDDGGGSGGWFQTAVTVGNYHEVNLRDKVIVAYMIERLRLKKGLLSSKDFEGIPFDILQIRSPEVSDV